MGAMTGEKSSSFEFQTLGEAAEPLHAGTPVILNDEFHSRGYLASSPVDRTCLYQGDHTATVSSVQGASDRVSQSD